MAKKEEINGEIFERHLVILGRGGDGQDLGVARKETRNLHFLGEVGAELA